MVQRVNDFKVVLLGEGKHSSSTTKSLSLHCARHTTSRTRQYQRWKRILVLRYMRRVSFGVYQGMQTVTF